MQKKAEENVFFSHKNLWCCHTPVVNFNSKTIEHRTRTGFLTRDNAEKAYDGIEHSDRAGNVITVDHVADSVSEGNSGNHEDNAADDHGIKIFSGAEAVTEDAKEGDPGTAENGAHDPSQMRIAEIDGIGLIQASDNNGTQKIPRRAAKHDAKAGTGESGHGNLQSSRKARMLLDAGQLSAYMLRGKSFFLNAP